ncbi:hypothetical protein BU14_1634s0001, partial [Porphyra umbilicalis]
MAKKTALPFSIRAAGVPRRPNRWLSAGGHALPRHTTAGAAATLPAGPAAAPPRKWALKEARAVRRGVVALATLTLACATVLYVLVLAPGGRPASGEGGGGARLLAAGAPGEAAEAPGGAEKAAAAEGDAAAAAASAGGGPPTAADLDAAVRDVAAAPAVAPPPTTAAAAADGAAVDALPPADVPSAVADGGGAPWTPQFTAVFRADYVSGTRSVCRVPAPCLLSNGTWVLPAHLAAAHRSLSRCGLGFPLRYADTPGVGSVSMAPDADYLHTHTRPPPAHMAHFFPEVIMKGSFFAELGRGRGDLAPNRTCVTDGGPGGGAERCVDGVADGVGGWGDGDGGGGGGRAGGRPTRTVLRPAMLLPTAAELAAKGGWSAAAWATFGAAYGPVTAYTAAQLLRPADAGGGEVSATCFRSVVASAPVYRHVPPVVFGDGNAYFAAAGVARTPAVADAPAGDAPPARRGTLRVTVLTRARGGRSLVNADALAAAVRLRATTAAVGPVGVEVVHFDASPPPPLAAQRATLAATDVLLGAHGAGLTNVVWMRPGGALVEVFPFGFRPGLFGEVAAALGLVAEAVGSAPDAGAFHACMRAHAEPAGVARYDAAAAAWAAARAGSAAGLREPLALEDKREAVSSFAMRSCARAQALLVPNVEEVAAVVVGHLGRLR